MVKTIDQMEILLIEPSHTQTQLINRMLNEMKVHHVRHAHNGNDALKAMREKIPDVVISSLYLPDIPGTDLVMQMRREARFETVPFVLISSETRPQVLDPVRQSGACCILAKPFDRSQLWRALETVIHIYDSDSDSALEDEEMDKLSVLLVDDSLVSRHHVRRLLNSMGIIEIIEAENGKKAIELLRDTMVDLVLTDYNMPEMDGKELIEYIRTQSWQVSVPILLITSEQDSNRLAAVEKAGVSAICDKPFDAQTLRSLIAQAMRDYNDPTGAADDTVAPA